MKKIQKLWQVIKPGLPVIVVLATILFIFGQYCASLIKSGEVIAKQRYDTMQQESAARNAEIKGLVKDSKEVLLNLTEDSKKQIDTHTVESKTIILKEVEKELPKIDNRLSDSMFDSVNKAREDTQ